jgi:alpha-beta hydrolase superfamily lysophospholipase
LKWAGIIVIVLALVFVFVIAPFLMAQLVTRAGTRPMDRGISSTPAEYGVAFEDVTFVSADGVKLEGWYLGGGERGVSVACAHGLFRSRHELLERAAWLRQTGFNVLVFDLRRHGKSGGERISLGYKERLDLESAASYLAERSPGDRMVLLGVSMGAAASLLAAAEDSNVAAVVADSSFLSLEHTVAHHLKLFWGLPKFPLGYELVFFVEQLAGFKAEDLDMEKAVQQIGRRPILFIAGGGDRRMPVEIQRRLFQAAGSPLSRFVVIEDAGHGGGYRTDPEGYQEAVLGFIEDVLGEPSDTSGG